MAMVDELKKVVEVEVKKLISDNSDAVVAAAIAALEKAIPGGVDDAILEAAKSEIQSSVKAALLALADKISDAV